MYTKELYITRIKLIALSRIRQIVDSVKERPAEYQNELGEDNIYDLGWNSWVEDFFRTEIA